MTTPASPRRVTWLTGAGFLFLGIALVTWGWCAWTNWWIADVHERPRRELDVPLPVTDGAGTLVPFFPNAGIPHHVLVEFDAGFPTEADGPCPVGIAWGVTAEDRGIADGIPTGHRWRPGEPGMGIVWLGRFDAVRDEEHLVAANVVRGLPGATARLMVVRDDDYLMNARILSFLLTRLAIAPAGLGLVLFLVSWFLRRYQLRRRPQAPA